MKYVFLVFLFFITLVTRLYFAFLAPHFGLEAYFALDQVEHILATGLPAYYDSLSYGGRLLVFMPLFYYVLAGFSLLFPLELVAKVLPNLFAALLVPAAFVLAKRVSKNEHAALFTAFICAFIPIFFSATIHSVSPLTLLLPLMVYQTYCFIDRRIKTFIALSFLLPLIHYTALLFPLSMLVFLLITKVERFPVDRRYVELTVFSITVTLWVFLLFYKNGLFSGIDFFFKHIPLGVLFSQLLELNLVRIVSLLGAIPLIYGVFSAYSFLFRDRTIEGFVLLSLVLTPFVMLFTTALALQEGLLFLGVFLTVLFSYHYNSIQDWARKTKFAAIRYYWVYFLGSMIVTFILAGVVPSLLLAHDATQETLQPAEYDALLWINNNTHEDAVVLGSLEEGYAITLLANRANVLDPDFLLAPNAATRYEAYQRFLVTPFITETVGFLNTYDVEYIYFSRLSVNFPDRFDRDCFLVRYNESVTILEVTCTLTTE